jgi:hypothetical protein
MAFTFFGPAFQQVHLASGLMTLLTRSYNPAMQAQRFGLFRFRSPLLSESRLIYFPPGTEMVHFPGFARTRLWIQRAVSRVHRDGFPHSDTPGSKPACGSPGLFAACHVLHRQLAPRHPPYALSSLTIKLTQHVASHCASLARWGSGHTQKSGCGQVRLSTSRYSSRTCGLRPSSQNLGTNRRICQLSSVVKEHRPSVPGTSPLPVGRWASLELTQRKTKNPASSAGPVRQTCWRVRSKLDPLYPVFVPNFTSN